MELKATILATGLISTCGIMPSPHANQFIPELTYFSEEQVGSRYFTQHTNDIPAITQLPPPATSQATDKNFDLLISKLADFLKLTPGWDTEESVPPSVESIEDTLSFIKRLRVLNFPYPQPMLSTEGQIGLFWDESGVFIDIEIEGNNKISYFAKDTNGEKIGADDIDFSLGIPKDLVFFLKKINSSQQTESITAKNTQVNRKSAAGLLDNAIMKGWGNKTATNYLTENYALT